MIALGPTRFAFKTVALASQGLRSSMTMTLILRNVEVAQQTFQQNSALMIDLFIPDDFELMQQVRPCNYTVELNDSIPYYTIRMDQFDYVDEDIDWCFSQEDVTGTFYVKFVGFKVSFYYRPPLFLLIQSPKCRRTGRKTIFTGLKDL